MALVAVKKRARGDSAGIGEYEFGCDWPGCEAREHWRGERASEAALSLKKHGDWGSRATEGLYCGEHAPRAVELARRLGRHDVLPQAIRVGNLLAVALGNVEERYAFAGEGSCVNGVPAAPLGEGDVGFGCWTSVAPGIAAFELGDGRKLLFTAHDVTAEHDRMVQEDRYGGEARERIVPRDYWSGGHRPFRDAIHDPEDDREIDRNDLLGRLIAGTGALDGDEVEIVVRKTGARPFDRRIFARAEPHGYAPVEPESPKGRAALAPQDYHPPGGCSCCRQARERARSAGDAKGGE